ncbi:hypothetical protein RSOLAG1IB_11877 [Rhizoctonia solani AG-1 IB]|uniref:Uncharacterized protein n=1 Tax=Thanatephorus cucumeris (strain AG1-IB / isolate 7/3/14) TaxID=1108050 RepID=A0A0B7FIW6_THACB|nr:hypothetical protein RSOLAG1IB_11877 [Rhizoctonia solani AG-1 IB]
MQGPLQYFNKYKQVPPQDQELENVQHRTNVSAVHAVNFAAPPAVTSFEGVNTPAFPVPSPYDLGYSLRSENKSYNHIRESTSAIWSEYDKWTEYIHPNGSLYWTCSAYPGRVVSDVKPPLSTLDAKVPSTISRIMDGLGEVPLAEDCHNWEIYTDGTSCVYIDHGSRTASNGFESLGSFRSQVQKLQGQMDIESRLKLEAAYWTYMQSHPNHRELPEGAIDDATEALVWCHAGKFYISVHKLVEIDVGTFIQIECCSNTRTRLSPRRMLER